QPKKISTPNGTFGEFVIKATTILTIILLFLNLFDEISKFVKEPFGLLASILTLSLLWAVWRSKIIIRKKKAALILLILCVAVFGGLTIYNKSEVYSKSINISWPMKSIEGNIEQVGGQLFNFSPDTFGNIDVKLFIHPEDGDSLYWLNESLPAKINNGNWHLEGRFGDEDPRSMKKHPPLDFHVYAVVVEKNKKLPLEHKTNYLIAHSEKEFIEKVKPYTKAISDRFIVTRIPSTYETGPVTLSVNSPVKVTWAEKVPMFLQIYHKGNLLQEGIYEPPVAVLKGLLPDPIMYEVKLSREKGYPKSNIWFLVEEGTVR
ncbi:MAG: DUF2157 domain-containing protein, partial [Bacteroidetes bacterium]|nr:DUF2157 domain-containing protein [Bacteroidota bacterium]